MSDPNHKSSSWFSVIVGKVLLACGFLIMALVTGQFWSEVFGFGIESPKNLSAFIGLALLGAGYAHVRIAKLEATVGKDSPDSES